MIKTLYGNVLTIPHIFICHQVNCRAVMGAGVAGQVKKKWPKAYEWYFKDCKWKSKEELLGSICPVPVEDNVSIIHMFAQDDYGRSDKCYTDYEAFERCLHAIKNHVPEENTIIRFPYKIGCGLAGGDWNIIQKLIYEILGDYNVEFYTLDPEPHII
jgi:O-acetyl-ADP-ribose deacetylase (regulator of RNase III)